MTANALVTSFFSKHRIFVILGTVFAFHTLAILALQSGLLLRSVELVVPVQVLAQIIEPPKPVVPPPPVVPKETPPPKTDVVKQTPKPPAAQTQAPPQILAVETAAPAPSAPTAVQSATPAPLLPPPSPVAALASPAPMPAPAVVPLAKVVLPSSEGDYLHNPKPLYPAMSKRLGEQGSVDIRIFVSAEGLPQKVELLKTSGFERLDQAALAVVMRWTFVPGKRGGVPEAMWMATKIKFEME
jgi:periplasmic protein TonB